MYKSFNNTWKACTYGIQRFTLVTTLGYRSLINRARALARVQRNVCVLHQNSLIRNSKSIYLTDVAVLEQYPKQRVHICGLPEVPGISRAILVDVNMANELVKIAPIELWGVLLLDSLDSIKLWENMVCSSSSAWINSCNTLVVSNSAKPMYHRHYCCHILTQEQHHKYS